MFNLFNKQSKDQLYSQLKYNNQPFQLGKTNQSYVNAYIDNKTQKIVAVKSTIVNSNEMLNMKLKEVDMLKKYKDNPHVIQYYNDFTEQKEFNGIQLQTLDIVMEYGISLQSIINNRSQNQRYFTEQELYCLIEGVLKAGAELEKQHDCHRDIKADNLLFIPNDFSIKLADFGEAFQNILDNKSTQSLLKNTLLQQVGTLRWMSPELRKMIKQNIQVNQITQYYQKSDIFSYGLVLYYLITLPKQDNNQILDQLNNDQQILNQALQQMKQQNKYNIKIYNLVTKMLNFDKPNDRPSLQNILKEFQEIMQVDNLQQLLQIKQQAIQTKNEEIKVLEQTQLDIIEQFQKQISEIDKNYQHIEKSNKSNIQIQVVQKQNNNTGKNKINNQEDDKFKQNQPSEQIAIVKQNYVEQLDEQVKQTLQKYGAFQYQAPQYDIKDSINILAYYQFIAIGDIYIGQWYKGKRNGQGKCIYSDGALYEGYWKDDQCNGYGRLIHSDGDIYVGEWKNNKANGKGKYIHMDGSNYDGDWFDDQYSGFGIEKWSSGAIYQGEYQNGKKHGKGNFNWPDSSYYQGEFKNNNIEGKGFYQWSDKRTFEGEWLNGKMHGYGVFKWPDGQIYHGNYINDKKEGYGEFQWPDGKIYKGQWKDGKQHGDGILYLPDGKQINGRWVDGKRIQQEE